MKKFFLLFFFLFPFIAQAKIYILIDEASERKFPIAVPQFVNEGGGQNELTQEITSLLKKDLTLAGYFKVLDETQFVEKDKDKDQIDFAKWTAIEAHGLVKGLVGDAGSGKSVLEMRLYDTDSQKLLVGKQYIFSKKDYPTAVHRFMDELMNALTGTRGPFSSRIVAACGKTGARQI